MSTRTSLRDHTRRRSSGPVHAPQVTCALLGSDMALSQVTLNYHDSQTPRRSVVTYISSDLFRIENVIKTWYFLVLSRVLCFWVPMGRQLPSVLQSYEQMTHTTLTICNLSCRMSFRVISRIFPCKQTRDNKTVDRGHIE